MHHDLIIKFHKNQITIKTKNYLHNTLKQRSVYNTILLNLKLIKYNILQ